MSRYLISTPAKMINCRCGAKILAGFDQGLKVRVDLTPLTPSGEIQALLEGRRTYALLASLDFGGELVHRDASRIHSRLTGVSIHAEHQCAVIRQPSLFRDGVMNRRKEVDA